MADSTGTNLLKLTDQQLDKLVTRYAGEFGRREIKEGTTRKEKEAAFLKLMDAARPTNPPDVNVRQSPGNQA